MNYGTPPFPVADDQIWSYGSGYVSERPRSRPGRNIGRGVAARGVPLDTASLVRLGDQLKNIPDTTEALQSPALTSNPFFSPFLKSIRTRTRAHRRPRRREPTGRLVDDFAAKWQAGKVPDLNAGLQQTTAEPDRSAARAKGSNGVAGVSVGAAALSSRVTSAEANATSRPPPEVGGRARLDVAVDHRIPRLHRLPDGREPVLLVHPLQPRSTSRNGSVSQLPVHGSISVLLGIAAQYDLDRHPHAVPTSDRLRRWIAMVAGASKPGRPASIERLLHPDHGSYRGGDTGVLFILNPASGPVNQILRFLHLPSRRGCRTLTGRNPVCLLGLWGVGNTMIIFLAAFLDVPQELYEAADSRARPAPSVPLRPSSMISPGDLLLDRDRR